MRQPWLWLGSIIFWLVRFEFAAGFPAKIGLTGNLALSADVFPRQGGFGGFSDCDLN
mgnify:FL=1